MIHNRRRFLQTTTAMAAGLAGGAIGGQAQRDQNSVLSIPDSEIRVPKVRFGKLEISRFILGVNPFYGFSHYNNNFSSVMQEWYTQGRVIQALQRAEAL
ncbi:MAG: twin-arginine translocation signal domain-containing protein, partial [Bryobacteraceae bacterium]